MGGEGIVVYSPPVVFCSLTDIARFRDPERSDYILQNWMRNRSTIEFIGLWELFHNPDFNSIEFDGIKNMAGSNSFSLTPKRWIEATKAKGIISKTGRYGGTFAHRDIAFEFATWISAEFKFYLIKEFQRLKAAENDSLQLEWNVKRMLSKTNYLIQTDAVQKHIIPKKNYTKDKEWLAFAEEADLLNVIVFGCTAIDWREANADHAAKNLNLRDFASINELAVLSNIESMNAVLIQEGMEKTSRFDRLKSIADYQLGVLNSKDSAKSLKKGRTT